MTLVVRPSVPLTAARSMAIRAWMLGILAWLAASLALVPGAVQARPVPRTWEHSALGVAARTWHPAQPFRIVYADPRTAGAVFPAGNDPAAGRHAVDPSGWATVGSPIYVNRYQRWLGYPQFCTVVVHEGGNVVGWGHDDWSNPNSIRYPLGTVTKTFGVVNGHRVVHWTGVYRRCLRR